MMQGGAGRGGLGHAARTGRLQAAGVGKALRVGSAVAAAVGACVTAAALLGADAGVPAAHAVAALSLLARARKATGRTFGPWDDRT